LALRKLAPARVEELSHDFEVGSDSILTLTEYQLQRSALNNIAIGRGAIVQRVRRDGGKGDKDEDQLLADDKRML
jgi:hypothetical protein